MLDFEALAQKQGWKVERRIFVAGERQVTWLPNLMAEIAVFEVSAGTLNVHDALVSQVNRASGWIIFSQEQLSEYSRSRIQSWIKEGRVQVNGAPAKAVAACCAEARRSKSPPPGFRRSRPLPKIFRWKFCTRTRR